MKKKIIAVIAVASMTAACLAGCGKNETSVEIKDDVSEITEETPAVSEDEYTEVPDENEEDTEIVEEQSGPYDSVEEGDTIEFGNYEGYTEWIVLAKEEDKMMLITKDLIKLDKFNAEQEKAIWETCTLRSWLNSDYYDMTFSAEEKALILDTTNKNYNNPIYYLGQGGEDTIDKVFLLSVDEEKELFSSNSDRRAYFEGSKYEWWIRTPGNNQFTAVFVNADGDDVVSGAGVGEAEIGVRPAIWIDITK